MKEVFQISPVLRVLFPYAIGAAAGMKINMKLPEGSVLGLCCLLWFLLVFLYLTRAFYRRTGPLYFMMVLLLAFCAGAGIAMQSRHSDPELVEGKMVLLRGKILKERGIRGKHDSFELITSLISLDSVPAVLKTRLYVYMEREEGKDLPRAGEEWQLAGRVVPIQNPARPGDPDFRSILARRNCFYLFYPDTSILLNRKLSGTRGKGLNAMHVRNRIAASWERDQEVSSLLRAMCLGDRSALDQDLRNAYADAGGMHLLAVSGLHVGLVWWVLNYALGFLVKLFKKEAVRVVAITLLLWYYAYLTGFSASVCRSVAMFSFYSLSRLIRYGPDSVHVTFVSALLLLMVRPSWVLEAGFQLSYVAVLSILTLYPLLRRLLKFRFFLFRKAWELTCISLSAQLGTLPLVVYYFHQFPVYGLASNLAAVPLLSAILLVFIISFPLTLLDAGELISSVLIFLGRLLNRLMIAIASLEGAVIGNLQSGRIQAFLSLAILFLLAMAWRRRRVAPLIPALFIAAFLLILLSI